ncbi:MAG TPA: hypothetical protein VHJ20_11700 [Polyangia bacterium]|nr:hypothetical protein [Polyangia bacterium]
MKRLALAAALVGVGSAAHAQTAAPPPAPTPVLWPADPQSKVDFQHAPPSFEPSPTLHRGGLALSVYGVERLDLRSDSTQSFGDFANNASLDRSGTAFGDTSQTRFTARNSLYGLKLVAPETSSVRAHALLEVGAESPDPDAPTGWHGLWARHAYAAIETPVLDVLVGRTHDLFGWGGHGFFPTTVATLGVPGEIYRQRGQVRISHVFRFDPVDFEIAIASVSQVQSSTNTADGEIGLRLAVNHWRGAATQGAGPPEARPLQVGISTIGRILQVPPFAAQPEPRTSVDAGGLALDFFVPIYPAHGDDLSNALSLAVEASAGSGIADLYPQLTGGVLYPALPNPSATALPTFTTDIPPRLLSYDAIGDAHTINWAAWMLNLRYHPPITRGHRLWISGTLSGTTSNNARLVTPPEGYAGVWTDSFYADANLVVAIWRGLQIAGSHQWTRQSFLDGARATNAREQFMLAYYF